LRTHDISSPWIGRENGKKTKRSGNAGMRKRKNNGRKMGSGLKEREIRQGSLIFGRGMIRRYGASINGIYKKKNKCRERKGEVRREPSEGKK